MNVSRNLRLQPDLILLSAGSALLAAALSYLLLVKGWDDLARQTQATIVVLIAVLTPVLGIALWRQHGAKKDLEAYGVSLYPGLGRSIGVATGNTAGSETWMFEFLGADAELLDFYREAGIRPGWELSYDSSKLLVLSRSDERLTVSKGDGTAIFVLTRDSTS